MATRFGYTEQEAEKVRTRLDRDLKSVEYFIGRIGRTVPQAGAITTRLQDAGETVQGVVSDLHDVIRERTEVAA